MLLLKTKTKETKKKHIKIKHFEVKFSDLNLVAWSRKVVTSLIGIHLECTIIPRNYWVYEYVQNVNTVRSNNYGYVEI